MKDLLVRIRRASVLPQEMDLQESMREWKKEGLGKSILARNKETKKAMLIGYILPVASEDAFLIVFNNGMVRKGQVTAATELERFIPAPNAWELPERPAIYDEDGLLTDKVAKKYCLDVFAKHGLKITLSNDNEADIEELRSFVGEALIQVQVTRAGKNAEISETATVSGRRGTERSEQAQ